MTDMIRKTASLLLMLFLLCTCIYAGADSVVREHYVFQNWAGEYTGQVDSGGIPFGFGVFESDTPLEGETESWHYIGLWENGLPEGEGSIYLNNGNMRKGIFSQGEMVSGIRYTVSGLAATLVEQTRTEPQTDALYIGNKNSLRFHRPDCRSVQQMKEKNKVEFYSREEAIDRHYIPCGECNP